MHSLSPERAEELASVAKNRIAGSEGVRTLVPPSRAGPRADAAETTLECARFFELGEDQLYTVTHSALRARRGAVLLCGPFAVERERTYLTLVQWARTLAASGFEVLRFDYRGNGESSGAFEDMTLTRCREDAAFCAARVVAAGHGGTLVLHGVRLGALIAAELFAAGVGDGLLLWAPPDSAEELLRDTLRHNLVAQRVADPRAPSRTREQLIAALEAGELVNVDGYSWTRALWQDAQRHRLLLPAPGERRPWHVLQVASAVPGAQPSPASQPSPAAHGEAVDADTFWKSSSASLVPRSEAFTRASLRWLDANEPWRASV
jgi:alpha/beta superfamily hydrolase